MPTLAPKLPWTHAFAGGYPRLGGQPLPTDPDAIDYLERVAAADGAAVEVGVAMAVDDFIKGMKADGIWDAIKASCILCGARTLAGALVPLVGTAPTNVANNFASGDYDRSSGLKGDGSTKYLDSNRANNADPQDDQHLAIYASEIHPNANDAYIGAEDSAVFGRASGGSGPARFSSRMAFATSGNAESVGLMAVSRAVSTTLVARASGSDVSVTTASSVPSSSNVFTHGRNNGGLQLPGAGRLAFYSIGESLDLAALDNRVSTLVSAIAAAL